MHSPTHLFLVTATEADHDTPALPGTPKPPHRVDVSIFSLDYSEDTAGGVDLYNVVHTVQARALIAPSRRMLPWTMAKRYVLPALESMYTTRDWSLAWATTKQAHHGRGRWGQHASTLEDVSNWSGDMFAWEAEAGLYSGVPGDLDPDAKALDSAVAANGVDGRNFVGLGVDTKGLGRHLPTDAPPAALDGSTVYWDRWDLMTGA